MKKSITIIIPALNEEATIGDVVKGCLKISMREDFTVSVIVVNDGSTDQTAQIAKDAGAVVISHAVNLGVGKTFQTGLSAALKSGADIVVNIDADGQFDPNTIPQLIEPIICGRADCTSASRFKDPELIPNMPKSKLWGNYLMSRIISRIAGQKFYDVSCGFRAYSRDTALRLSLWGHFTYTQESILDLSIKGMRVEEVPMKIQGVRSVGESRVASSLWKYGFRSMKIILRTYLDYWPISFFGWISLPFMLMGAGLIIFLLAHRFISGSFSPHIWAGFTGVALFGFGLIVLITGLIGEILKRIRLNQEMMLYYHRRDSYCEQGAEPPAPQSR